MEQNNRQKLKILRKIGLGCNVLGAVVLMSIVLFVIFSPKKTPHKSTNRTIDEAPFIDYLTFYQKICKRHTKYACDNPMYYDPASNFLDGKFPHLAFIQIFDPKESVISACSGSLISKLYVMSAAHCVYDIEPQHLVIKLGSWSNQNKSSEFYQWYRVREVHIHYEYKHGKALHDISLLKLTREVHFTKTIRPVCLYTQVSSRPKGAQIDVCGWAYNKYGSTIDDLQQMKWVTADEKQCQTKWGEDFLQCLLICATHWHTKRQNNLCQVHPGAALQIPSSSECLNTYEQIGIAVGPTYLEPCDFVGKRRSSLGLYIKIEAYLPWIMSIVWPLPPGKQPIIGEY